MLRDCGNKPLEVCSGQQLRNYEFSSRISAEAVLLVAPTPETKGKVFNVGGSDVLALATLAETMIEVNGGGRYEIKDFPYDRKVIDIGSYHTDDRSFRKVTDWSPQTTVVAGLRRTLDFYRAKMSHYIWLALCEFCSICSTKRSVDYAAVLLTKPTGIDERESIGHGLDGGDCGLAQPDGCNRRSLSTVLGSAMTLIVAWRLLPTFLRILRPFANIAMGATLVIATLAAAGVFGHINDNAGAPKDVALVIATLMHALLGCAILIAQWAAGAGLARIVIGAKCATLSNVLLLGFALSLPLTAFLAGTALLAPHGASFAVTAWLVCCLPLFRWQPEARELAALARVGIAVLPFAIGFGCWMGLHWHGPTDTLAGSPSGDLVFYSTSIVSLSKQLFPYLNLGYEREPFNTYFNMLFPGLGAALSSVFALDPFLFITTSGATFSASWPSA